VWFQGGLTFQTGLPEGRGKAECLDWMTGLNDMLKDEGGYGSVEFEMGKGDLVRRRSIECDTSLDSGSQNQNSVDLAAGLPRGSTVQRTALLRAPVFSWDASRKPTNCAAERATLVAGVQFNAVPHRRAVQRNASGR
jgi:hypothetical protein